MPLTDNSGYQPKCSPEMPVYAVDPNWIQKILLSPSFFISAAVVFICSYVISPFLAGRLIPQEKYQKLGRKTRMLHTYLSSAVHGVMACILASSVLAFGDLGEDKIFARSSAAADTCLHFTLGYIVADTIQCFLDPYMRGMYATLLHHVAMITGISMGLYHQLFLFFIVYRFLSEFSTPFVDLWSVIHEVGDRKGWWYSAASVGMMTSFFLCRIMVIPWHNYKLFAAILSSDGLVVPWHLRVIMIVNFTAFDAFNAYWFYKMLRGGYKLLCQKRKHKE